MRSKIPEHVYIPLYKAQIDAHRVYELDLADLPLPDQLPDPLDCWRVAVRVVAHQYQAVLARHVRQFLSFRY